MLDDIDQDVLSSVLMRMKLKASAATSLDAGGKWALQFPANDLFKLQLILKGQASITVDGEHQNYHVKAGDSLLFTGGKSFVVASDVSVQEKINAESLYATAARGVLKVGSGGDFLSAGTVVQFDGHLHKIVFANMPSVIHVPGHVDQAAVLRWSIDMFRAEYLEPRIGRSLFLNSLTNIMLLQMLRIYLASAHAQKNWLSALRDPKLARAIDVMHSNYQNAWSLESLAKVAGLSRSGFALNFKTRVGITPMEYLTNWRIQIACAHLQEDEMSMYEIANAVGYESESAFSDAFKRILNCRPGFYQKNIVGRAFRIEENPAPNSVANSF